MLYIRKSIWQKPSFAGSWFYKWMLNLQSPAKCFHPNQFLPYFPISYILLGIFYKLRVNYYPCLLQTQREKDFSASLYSSSVGPLTSAPLKKEWPTRWARAWHLLEHSFLMGRVAGSNVQDRSSSNMLAGHEGRASGPPPPMRAWPAILSLFYL